MLKNTNIKTDVSHREDVLHCDDKDVVGYQEVPVVQDLLDGFEQQLSAKQQEVETRHQVAHAENTDACGTRDEDNGQDKPEQVAERDHLQHVQIRPAPGSKFMHFYTQHLI